MSNIRKHTIYLVPGVKVGCTNNFNRRKTEYPPGTQFEILAELFCTIKEAANEERAWSWAYGFKHAGWPYEGGGLKRTDRCRKPFANGQINITKVLEYIADYEDLIGGSTLQEKIKCGIRMIQQCHGDNLPSKFFLIKTHKNQS